MHERSVIKRLSFHHNSFYLAWKSGILFALQSKKFLEQIPPGLTLPQRYEGGRQKKNGFHPQIFLAHFFISRTPLFFTHGKRPVFYLDKLNCVSQQKRRES